MSTKITRFRNLLILALMCLVSGSVWGQTEVLAEWNFVAKPTFTVDTNNKGIAVTNSNVANKNAILKYSGTPSTTAGSGPYYLNATGAKNAYFYTTISTIGYTNISVSWDGSSNQGSGNNVTLQYSINNGSDFQSLTERGYNKTATTFTESNIPCSNTENVIFRWTITTFSKGTIRIGEIYIKGETAITSVTPPTISPESCEFAESQEVTITQSEGADIYYTTDGNKPTSGSIKYTAPFTINATTTVRAIAIKNGVESDEAEARIYTKQAPANKVNTPIFDEASGNFEIEKLIILSCSTEETKIYYNINEESNPTSTSTLYDANQGITITETSTIKAIAIKEGLDDSEVATAIYTKVLATPGFKYSSESASVNLGETFIAPTLSYNGNSDLSGLTISYTSSDTNVATINAEGVVTLGGSAGKTTITASVSATNDYEAAEATYTLTVIDPNACFVLAVNYNNKWYAVSQDINDKAKSVEIEVNNKNEVISDVTGLLWTIEEDKYLKTATGKYLFHDGTKTNINLQDNVFEWILEKQSNESYYIKSNSNTSRYLGYQDYDTQNKPIQLFGAYSNSNITEKAYSFNIYILSAAAPEEPKSTIDPVTGAMTLTGAWTAEAVKALEIPANVTSVDMTAINVDVLSTTIGNPNCLFYVKENSTLKDLNVIAGNSAITGIKLQDGYDFYNTKSFTGDITYSRTFASGWNTFALPFNAAIPNDVKVEAFDKKDGNQILFTEATSIEANTAYLINVQADGKISFAANNVTVPVTATTGDTYKSNFLHMTGDDIAGKYILVLEESVEVFARANTGAQMHAFRGYLDLPAASGAQYSISHDGGATGINHTDIEGIKIYSVNGTLIINADKTQSVQIYGLDGRMVKNIQVSEGENTVTGLAKGIYLINNQKAIIK